MKNVLIFLLLIIMIQGCGFNIKKTDDWNSHVYDECSCFEYQELYDCLIDHCIGMDGDELKDCLEKHNNKQ